MANFSHMISVIDTHAAGEPTRIVLSGLPPVLGATMAAKKQFMRDHLDHFRTLLMQEPRGHRDMFGAVLTPPLRRALNTASSLWIMRGISICVGMAR